MHRTEFREAQPDQISSRTESAAGPNLSSDRIPYWPIVTDEDIRRELERRDVEFRSSFGGRRWSRTESELESEYESATDFLVEEDLERTCADCGFKMRAHEIELVGPFFANGAPKPNCGRNIFCPEPFPVSDSEGRDNG